MIYDLDHAIMNLYIRQNFSEKQLNTTLWINL